MNNCRAPSSVRPSTIMALRAMRKMSCRVRLWISAKAFALSRPKLTRSPPESGRERETHDPLDAVDIYKVGCETVAILPLITSANQFLTDKSVIVRIACKVGAVAIGDGQRVSRRNTRARDVVR